MNTNHPNPTSNDLNELFRRQGWAPYTPSTSWIARGLVFVLFKIPVLLSLFIFLTIPLHNALQPTHAIAVGNGYFIGLTFLLFLTWWNFKGWQIHLARLRLQQAHKF